MPTLHLPNHRHHHDICHVLNPSPGRTTPRSPRSFPSSEKPNSKVLSFFLKAAVMAVVTSCFFLFVGFASILLLLLQLCLANTAFRNRHHHHRQLPNSEVPHLGYSLEDLRKLPRIRYTAHAGDPSESVDDCVVCLSNLMDGDWCRILPNCGHKFHVNCIDKWLIKVPFCPICRRRVRLTGDSIGAASGKVEDSKRGSEAVAEEFQYGQFEM